MSHYAICSFIYYVLHYHIVARVWNLLKLFSFVLCSPLKQTKSPAKGLLKTSSTSVKASPRKNLFGKETAEKKAEVSTEQKKLLPQPTKDLPLPRSYQLLADTFQTLVRLYIALPYLLTNYFKTRCTIVFPEWLPVLFLVMANMSSNWCHMNFLISIAPCLLSLAGSDCCHDAQPRSNYEGGRLVFSSPECHQTKLWHETTQTDQVRKKSPLYYMN